MSYSVLVIRRIRLFLLNDAPDIFFMRGELRRLPVAADATDSSGMTIRVDLEMRWSSEHEAVEEEIVASMPGDNIAGDVEARATEEWRDIRVGVATALGLTLFCKRRCDTLWGKARVIRLLSTGSGDATENERSANNPRL